MSDASLPSPPPDGAEAPPHRRRNTTVFLIVFGIAALVGMGFLAFLIIDATETPSFPALADDPDPSLHGTVAYLDWSTHPCLTVISASGAEAKQLACTGEDESWPTELVWLPDGRIQATSPGEYQRTYDVETGDVEEAPADEVPDETEPGTPSSENAAGQEVAATSDGGKVEIVLTEPDGTSRNLLTAEGGEEYSLGNPVWSPDGAWVLTTDTAARILLTTVDDAPTTRILAEEFQTLVAVTEEDLLTESG